MFVSSFSIFALLFSFVVLLIYGYTTYGAHIDSSVLGPRSLSALFSSMGVPAFSLGYNFSFLTFYVGTRSISQVDGAETVRARQGGNHEHSEHRGVGDVPRGDADDGLLLLPRLARRNGAERAGEHSEGPAGVDDHHGVHVPELSVHISDRDSAAERDHRGQL